MSFASPSIEDGISEEEERSQLRYACDLIRDSCLALQLSSRVSANAQFLLQRFYALVSLKAHCSIWAVGAVILLAGKIVGEQRTLRNVANVLYDRILDREGLNQTILVDGKCRRKTLDFYGAEGYEWKLNLTETEYHVLKELGFRLAVELPHNFVLVFINTLREKAGAPKWTEEGVSEFRNLLQAAWNYANDCLLHRICVLEEPEAIACACISLAIGHSLIKLPPEWACVFGVDASGLKKVTAVVQKIGEVCQEQGQFVDYSNSLVFRELFEEGRNCSTINKLSDNLLCSRRKDRDSDAARPPKKKRRRSKFEDAVS